MLVIRRRPGECLLIGPDVEIEILDATTTHVKLGVRAPKNVLVLRKEIRLTEQQNQAACEVSQAALSRLLGTLR